MNPDMESFLEDAFATIQPTSPAIGRVVVEPDYEVTQSPGDASRLTSELTELLRTQSPNPEALNTPHGWEVQIPNKSSVLGRYVQQIVLHGNRLDGPWVEVAPPGNWI